MVPAVPCPSCGAALPPGGSAHCPTCRLPLRGPLARRLWEVDQGLAALTRERARLLAALRQQGVAPAADVTGTGPAGTGVRPVRWSGQQVLLGVGVLLVLVASLVFLAVAWDVIGVGGQVLAMALLTCLTAYGALRLSRQRLHSSAEALGTLTAGLLLLDAAAARALGVAGLSAVDGRTYAAATGALTAVVLAALHVRDAKVRSFGVGSVVAAAAAWAAVLAWFTQWPALFAAVALAGAAGFAVAANRLPARTGLVRTASTVPAVSYLVVALLVAGVAALDDLRRDGLTAAEAGASMVLAVIAGGGYALVRAVLRERDRRRGAGRAGVAWAAGPLTRPWWPVTALAAAVVVAGPAAVTALAGQTGTVTTALASVAVAGGVATLSVRPRGPWSWALLGMGLLSLLGLVAAAGHWSSQATAGITVGAVAASTAVLSVARREVRPVGSAVAALTGAASIGLAAEGVGDAWLVVALVVVALGVTAAAAWRRSRPEEASLGLAALLTVTVAQLWALGEGWVGTVSLLLALEGTVAGAYAVLLRRRWVVTGAAAAWSGAVWVLAADAGVSTPEAYSLPAAAFALVAGLWLLGRTPGLPSWVSVGPAMALALLPSALKSMDDEGWLRPLLTLVVSAAVLALGVRLRWQAMVVLGGAAAALVATSQLAPYAVGLPRWLVLGATGAALLALGARYERRRRDAVRAAHCLAHLR